MLTIHRRKASLLGYCLIPAMAVSGCATDVPYKSPIFPFAASYSTVDRSVPAYLNNAEWWTGFNDPTLNALVDTALSGSLDLELARERVVEARENSASVAPLGTVTPSASVRREEELGISSNTREEASLGFSWLLDPYGRRRQQVEAATARVEVADAEVDAARLLLLLNVTNTYIDLRSNQRTLQLRRSQMASRRQAVELTERLFERQAATKLDVVLTKALMTETQALIPSLQAEIRRNKIELAILAGKRPGQLSVNLDTYTSQPRPKMSPEVGIPSDLLRNRPDIRIAERLYYAAITEIGVAKADLYPRLSLAGSISLVSSNSLSGTEYFFGPTVQLPAFPNDDRRAVVRARHSQARQAHTSWKSAVLGAAGEVESALAAYQSSFASVDAATRSARLYREAASLTRDLVERDNATIRDLVNAEEDIADADVLLTQNLRQLARNYVALNVNLGSGNSAKETEVHNVAVKEEPATE